jgi:uncharacterized protein (TIGR03067 family)
MIRFALLAGLLVAPSPARADDKKDDLAPFQGTWKVVKAVVGGKVQDGVKLQFTFSGAKADYVEGDPATGKKGTGSIKIDATKTPREIDLFAEKGEKSPGIYKFEDKNAKLVICFVKGGDKRPTEFASDDGSEVIVLTLEKVEKK